MKTLAWADILQESPDPKIIPDAGHRSAMAKAGLPWHVRDKRSGIEMLLIPPGAYMRGASPGDSEAQPDEKPAHQVTITKAFYLSQFEVTNGQFRRFRPTHDSGSYENHSLNGDTQPVVQVSWYEAVAFLGSYGLRLPTDGEWEYAARAATTGSRHGDLDTIAWYDKNSATQTEPVGQKAANAFGLHDMIGNVWEWCSDWFAEYSEWASGILDPKGPAFGTARMVRGGSWLSGPRSYRSSVRFKFAPSIRTNDFGFRAARTP